MYAYLIHAASRRETTTRTFFLAVLISTQEYRVFCVLNVWRSVAVRVGWNSFCGRAATSPSIHNILWYECRPTFGTTVPVGLSLTSSLHPGRDDFSLFPRSPRAQIPIGVPSRFTRFPGDNVSRNVRAQCFEKKKLFVTLMLHTVINVAPWFPW